MADIPTRRVRIAKDSASPCWFITCVDQCEPGGCQTAPNGRRLCWLGTGSSEDVARRLAERWGYTVEDAPRSHTDARAGQAAAAAQGE